MSTGLKWGLPDECAVEFKIPAYLLFSFPFASESEFVGPGVFPQHQGNITVSSSLDSSWISHPPAQGCPPDGLCKSILSPTPQAPAFFTPCTYPCSF